MGMTDFSHPEIRGHRRSLTRFWRRFWRTEDGVALVEFAMVLPLLMLLFAVTVEGGRMMWSYQTVVSGVRDASRYLGRVTPLDLCATGGSVSPYAADLLNIVRNSISGEALLPSGITVNSVTPSLACVATGLRVSPSPVVTVTASVTITFPFAGIFTFFGRTQGALTTTVSDQSKVFGT